MKTYKAILPNVNIHASCDVLVSIKANTPEEAVKKLKIGDFNEREFGEIWGDCMDMPKFFGWVKMDDFDFASLIEEAKEGDFDGNLLDDEDDDD